MPGGGDSAGAGQVSSCASETLAIVCPKPEAMGAEAMGAEGIVRDRAVVDVGGVLWEFGVVSFTAGAEPAEPERGASAGSCDAGWADRLRTSRVGRSRVGRRDERPEAANCWQICGHASWLAVPARAQILRASVDTLPLHSILSREASGERGVAAAVLDHLGLENTGKSDYESRAVSAWWAGPWSRYDHRQ